MTDDAPTDWKTAVLDAIQHLDGHADPGGDWDDSQEFQMKAAHDRLSHLDTSDAPRDVAETIRDVANGLAETPNAAPDEWGVIAQTALAQLGPIAARVASDRPNEDTGGSDTEKPTVPLFYHIPQAAADRAIDRFKHCRERDPMPGKTKWLAEFVYDEIEEEHTIWVEDEPLGDYAGGRVESLKIEADDDADGDQVIRCRQPAPDHDAIPESAETIRDVVDGLAETPNAAPDHDAIPESADDVERIKDPTAAERAQAKRDYGDACLPGEGPIPNPRPSYQVPVDITVPEWILEIVAGRIEDLDDPSRTTVEGHIMDYAIANERFLAPDGRDAVEVLLEEYDRDDTDV